MLEEVLHVETVPLPGGEVGAWEDLQHVSSPEKELGAVKDKMFACFFCRPAEATVCQYTDVRLGEHAVGEVVEARCGLEYPT